MISNVITAASSQVCCKPAVFSFQCITSKGESRILDLPLTLSLLSISSSTFSQCSRPSDHRRPTGPELHPETGRWALSLLSQSIQINTFPSSYLHQKSSLHVVSSFRNCVRVIFHPNIASQRASPPASQLRTSYRLQRAATDRFIHWHRLPAIVANYVPTAYPNAHPVLYPSLKSGNGPFHPLTSRQDSD